MSAYQQVLPEVFPLSVTVDKDRAKQFVAELLEAGTSFAVTMDRPYTIHLSEASYQALLAGYFIPKEQES